MKKIFVYTFLGLALMTFSQNQVQAQGKIAFIDLQKVLPQIPEYQTAQTKMESYAKLVEEELKNREAELTTKLKDYQDNGAGYTQALRAVKERELQSLDRQLQEFQASIQQDAQKKEFELLSPIYEKVDKAIQDVASENAYAFVLKSEFCSATVKQNDISNKVLTKMGVTPSQN